MSATILVLDGFGIGAMPDAGLVRPADARSDTLGAVVGWAREERRRELRIPNLAGLGLALLRPELGLTDVPAGPAVCASTLPGPASTPRRVDVGSTARRSALGYPGADTFAGHQTMMGADMSHVSLCLLADRLEEVRQALEISGHRTELLDGRPVIVVDGVMLVHDNLEADPGLNWNVSARLDEVSWGNVLHAAQAVRTIAPVARVIAVGGYSERPLRDSVRSGDYGAVGLDTPASGFYRSDGLQVQHLGAPIDHRRQLPEVAARAGVPVTLVGKAADILQAETGVRRHPAVDTGDVLGHTLAAAREPGLVVANVQQTDLAGHQQDTARYAELLEQVDAFLPDLLAALRGQDLLVVVADHGNDPQVGHAFHTREYVPVLTAWAAESGQRALSQQPGSHRVPPGRRHGSRPAADLASLADVGASVALALGLGPDALGHGHAVDLRTTTYAPSSTIPGGPVPERTATIASTSGLHARPANLFVEAVQQSGLAVQIARPGQPAVDARSILSVMGLGAGHGVQVELRAEGDGAADMLEQLVRLLETDLDEGDPAS